MTIKLPEEKLNELADEWDKAEAYIKKAEGITENVTAVAIAELRYAGRRMIDAIREYQKSGESDDFITFADEARMFCYRAQHDAIDSCFLYLRKKLRYMQNRFGLELIQRHSSADYNALWDTIYEADETVSLSRGDRGKRNEVYDKLATEIIDLMVTTNRSLEKNEKLIVDEYNKRVRADNRRVRIERRTKWMFYGTFVFGIIGIIGTISALYTIFYSGK